MKRIMIYCIYDKEGIVDDYIPYFLQSFKPYCEEICVVINGKLTDDSKKVLEKNCNKLILRENIGFDSGAHKQAIESYGYEKIKEFDELILANDTFYGPIFPAEEIFNKMDKIDVDFWGITEHPAKDECYAGVKVEEHIQSYFIAYRNSILKSDCFKDYWDSLKIATNYDEAVAFHELRTTKYFKAKDYKSACFIPSAKYIIKLKKKKKPYFYYINQQIKEDRMPFVKRKFFLNYSNPFFPVKDGCKAVIENIHYSTSYDVNLILNSLKRLLGNNIKLKKTYNIRKYQLLHKIHPIKAKREKYTQRLKNFYHCLDYVDYLNNIN